MTINKVKANGLEQLARDAIAQYNKDLAAGGEPDFPEWAQDLLALLRSMLRAEAERAAGMGQARDMAIAKAVQAWYLLQHPQLKLCIEQPNIANIVAAVRNQPAAPATDMEKNAARYLALRNVPDDLLGKPGVPVVAVPEKPNTGKFVNGEDADSVVDALVLVQRLF